jgi:tRNA-modifying protein YgfZ
VDVAAQERALLEGVGLHRRELDVVEVSGPDAAKFLDGQISQAVESLAEGEARWSFVLQPQGKVVALVRVQRTGEGFRLITDAGSGDAVAERLKRFLLRVKAEIQSCAVPVVSLRGPGVAGHLTEASGGLPSLWEKWPGADVLEDAAPPDGDIPECSAEAWEAARIRMGVPVNGVDVNERTIPAETGLVDAAADFTKGCYVGQELVARIDSRGHVNRHLRRLAVEGPVLPAGAELISPEGRTVGTITSASPSALGGTVALGYVRREIEVGSKVTSRADEGGEVVVGVVG